MSHDPNYLTICISRFDSDSTLTPNELMNTAWRGEWAVRGVHSSIFRAWRTEQHSDVCHHHISRGLHVANLSPAD